MADAASHEVLRVEGLQEGHERVAAWRCRRPRPCAELFFWLGRPSNRSRSSHGMKHTEQLQARHLWPSNN
eukprot:8010875-Alexandrium_andersonii.AAC.1